MNLHEMFNPVKIKSYWSLLVFMPFFGILTGGLIIPHADFQNSYTSTDRSYCTQSERQIVYSSENSNPIVTYTAPVLAGKSAYVNSVDAKGDTVKAILSTKDISLILDQEAKMPGFIVFNKRGKPFCSLEMGLLDFPDYFSYRCLTKDRKVITAGVLKSQPVEPLGSVRKLVNDNINKEDIDIILKDNVVIECYKTSNWLGAKYTINVNVTPAELDYYKDDIISMLKEGYAKMDNATQLEADNSKDVEKETMKESEAAAETPPSMNTSPFRETESTVENNNPDETISELAQSENKENTVVDNVTDADVLPETKVKTSEEQPKNLGTREMPPKLDETISAEDKEAIQREAEDKLYLLQDCFVKLVNRKYSAQQKELVRETTVQDLFINDRANVGVSSLNSDEISNYLIGEYLLRLERMINAAYQKVEIVFSEIYKVSNFKLNPDGTWSATVTFSQEFRGFSDVDGQKVAYSDITQKNVTVKIRRVELFTGNSTPDVYWEVLLADIGVNQTQAF